MPTHSKLGADPLGPELRSVLDAVLVRSTSHGSELHGLRHWRRVAEIGRALAAETPRADADVVALFAIFHDAMRWTDGADPGHGARGAKLARDLRDLVPLDDRRFDLLARACETHTSAGVSADPTLGTCFDADRLDLGRVGIRPDPKLLSTKAGRERASRTPTVFVGWRVWRVDPFRLRLLSPESGEPWEPGREFVATCGTRTPGSRYHVPIAVPDHDVPGDDCSCGVYFAPDVQRAYGGIFGGGAGSGLMAGKVRLSGRVRPGEAEGEWRGERASLLCLRFPSTGSLSLLGRTLGETYGVPVERVSTIAFRSLGHDLRFDTLEAEFAARGLPVKRDYLGRVERAKASPWRQGSSLG
jgi:uncharacterized protein